MRNRGNLLREKWRNIQTFATKFVQNWNIYFQGKLTQWPSIRFVFGIVFCQIFWYDLLQFVRIIHNCNSGAVTSLSRRGFDDTRRLNYVYGARNASKYVLPIPTAARDTGARKLVQRLDSSERLIPVGSVKVFDLFTVHATEFPYRCIACFFLCTFPNCCCVWCKWRQFITHNASYNVLWPRNEGNY